MLQALLRQGGSRLPGAWPPAAALSVFEALRAAARSSPQYAARFSAAAAAASVPQAAEEAPVASAVQAAEAAGADGDAAWVAGATQLSQVAAAPAGQPRPPRPPRRWQQEPLQQAAGDAVPRVLGPKRLAAALGAVRSFRGAARLLLAHRDTVSSRHMVAAAERMGELAAARAGGRATTPDEHDAFGGAVELALELVRAEGSTLSLRDAGALLGAVASVGHPLGAAHMAALQAAALRGLQGEHSARAEVQLLAALLCLGEQPDAQLAAALAPAVCRGVDEQGRPAFVPLDEAALEVQLRLADEASLRRVMRLLALHAPGLRLRHHLAGMRALGLLVHEQPARLQPHLQRAFGALRARVMAEAAAGPEDGLDLPTVACLLSASADLRLAPSAEQQAALEAAVLRGLGEARVADLHPLLCAYDRLDLQPGSEEMAAALRRAAEWLLHAASPLQLRDSLRAWRGRGWDMAPPLAAAAEARALQHLRGDDVGAQGVAHLLEAFTADSGGFAPSTQLVAALRSAVLRHLASPLAADPPTDFASATLSCCRKLGMLPDRDLLAAFVGVAPRVLAGASEPAAAYAPRLLMAMQLQGWHYSTATAAVQRTMQALMQRVVADQAGAMERVARTVEERGSSLGLICHGLHLLSGVGLRPSDAHLKALAKHLRRYQRTLSRRQREWLRGALEAWQLGDLGIAALRRQQ